MKKSRNNDLSYIKSLTSGKQGTTMTITRKDKTFFPTAIPINKRTYVRAIDSFLNQTIQKHKTFSPSCLLPLKLNIEKAKALAGTLNTIPTKATNFSTMMSVNNTDRIMSSRLLSNITQHHQRFVDITPSLLNRIKRCNHKRESIRSDYGILTQLATTPLRNNQLQDTVSKDWKIELQPVDLLSQRIIKTKKKIRTVTNCKTHEPSKSVTIRDTTADRYAKKRKKEEEKKTQSIIESQKDYYNNKVKEYLNAQFRPIEADIVKQTKKQINSLFTEIEYRMKDKISIVNQEKFTSDYRYNFEIINEKKKEKENAEMLEKINKKFSLSKIVEDYSLRGEVKDRVNVIYEDEKQKKQRLQLEKWKKAIIKASIHFQRLNFGLCEFYKIKSGTIKPYENDTTYTFFQAIKDDDMPRMMGMIHENRNIMFDFDYFHQTMIHWMAKRNRYKMVSYAVGKGVNINAEDLAGRTPLHVAALMNNIEMIMILLYEFANPFLLDKDGRKPIDLTSNRIARFILKRAVLLYYIHTLGKAKLFETNLRRGLFFLYNDELRLNFSEKEYGVSKNVIDHV